MTISLQFKSLVSCHLCPSKYALLFLCEKLFSVTQKRSLQARTPCRCTPPLYVWTLPQFPPVWSFRRPSPASNARDEKEEDEIQQGSETFCCAVLTSLGQNSPLLFTGQSGRYSAVHCCCCRGGGGDKGTQRNHPSTKKKGKEGRKKPYWKREGGREGRRPLLPALCQRGLSILSLPPNGELKSEARSEGKRERPSSLMAGGRRKTNGGG